MRYASRPNRDQFARDAIEDRGLFDLSVENPRPDDGDALVLRQARSDQGGVS